MINRQILAPLLLATFWAVTSFAATPPAGPVGSDGLVTLQASRLDEFSVRPDAGLADYRKVIVDPAQVEFKKGWLRAINSTRDLSRWLTASDQQQIADTAAASLNTTIANAFKARGYEIVTTPGQGVLRVTPRVTELYVNAPDVPAAAPVRLFNVDAGDATLALEARDSASGTLLARVVDRGTARELSSRINPAFAVTNQFWFDAMFRQWTAAWIGEFGPVTAAR